MLGHWATWHHWWFKHDIQCFGHNVPFHRSFHWPLTVHKDNSKLLVQFPRPFSMKVSIPYPWVYLGLSHRMILLTGFSVLSLLLKSCPPCKTWLEYQPLHVYTMKSQCLLQLELISQSYVFCITSVCSSLVEIIILCPVFKCLICSFD